MWGASERVRNAAPPGTKFFDSFEACDYACLECRHTFFRAVLYTISKLEVALTPRDYAILGKPVSCPECESQKLQEKRFYWGDLPKEFVHAKLQGLLDTLSAEALVEVVKCIEHGPFSGTTRKFVGRYYLKAGRLGSPRAAQELIRFYHHGMHVPRNVLRAIAWAKRRYDFEGGEAPVYFSYLLAKYHGKEDEWLAARFQEIDG